MGKNDIVDVESYEEMKELLNKYVRTAKKHIISGEKELSDVVIAIRLIWRVDTDEAMEILFSDNPEWVFKKTKEDENSRQEEEVKQEEPEI